LTKLALEAIYTTLKTLILHYINNKLMLFGVINSLYCGNRTKHVSSLFGNKPDLS